MTALILSFLTNPTILAIGAGLIAAMGWWLPDAFPRLATMDVPDRNRRYAILLGDLGSR